MKFWLWVLAAFLVISPTTETIREYETFVYQTEVNPGSVSTPIADSLIDWKAFDVENDCLWSFLQLNNIELTLHNIVTTGDWADMNGGACALLGESNE